MDTREEAGALFAESRQPMSLLTVDRSQAAKMRVDSGQSQRDLLTLRILEASERKMQLIKQLLTAEEFDSLATELTNRSILPVDRMYPLARVERAQDTSIKSIPAQAGDDRNQVMPMRRKRLSRSEANLDTEQVGQTRSAERQSTMSIDERVQENLRKKREAVDFFFQESAAPMAKELRIELRNGHYLRGSQVPAAGAGLELVRQGEPQLKKRLLSVLSIFGLANLLESDIQGDPESADRRPVLANLDNSFIANSPFNRRHNLLTLCARLKADGQLDRIDPFLGSALDRSARGEPCDNRFELRALQCGPIIGGQKTKEAPKERLAKCSNQADGTCSPPVKSRRRELWQNCTLINHQQHNSLLINQPNLATRFRGVRAKLVQIRDGQREVGQSLFPVCLKLQLDKLIWLESELMSAEERQASRLFYLHERGQLLRENLTKVRSAILESLGALLQGQATGSRLGAMDLIQRAFAWWTREQARLRQMDIDLGSGWQELESMRREQQFSSTTLQIEPRREPNQSEPRLDDIRHERLVDYLTKNGLSEVDINKMLEWPDSSPFVVGQPGVVDLSSLKEVRTRREKFLRQVKCLRLKVIINDTYYRTYEMHELIGDHDQQQLTEYCFADLSATMSLRLANAAGKFVWLRCELCSSGLFGRRQLFASGELRIRRNGGSENSTREIRMFEINGQESRQVCCIRVRCNLEYRGSKEDETIEWLYDRLFVDSRPIPNSIQMKRNLLLNKIDLSLLSALVGIGQTKVSRNFLLDPLADEFKDEDGSRFRRQLLAWRWIHHRQSDWLRQQPPRVFLTDLENDNAFKVSEIESQWMRLSKEMEKLDNSPSSHSDMFGLKLIERMRAEAGEYLRNYELLLKAKLRHQSELKVTRSQRNKSEGVRSAILIEPKLRLIFKLPRLIINFRQMIPRARTGRRPLMPQRKQASKRLAEIVSQELLVSQQAKLADDLRDGRAVSHWHQFVELQRRQSAAALDRRQVQLLVTIQQANNVPMRIVFQLPKQQQLQLQLQQQQQQLRGSQSSSPIGPNTGRAALASPVSQMNSQPSALLQLVPATTYVEAIFQQKQQATSLAQGKDPSWNETLFFQIEQTDQSGQLVDEYLELNLYDYFLALAEESSDDDEHTSTARDQPRSAILRQRSRLERHLLGSLRVPLSTLLQNGRIEGSFYLSQPLFLDNHQYEATTYEADQGNANSSTFQLARPDLTCVGLFITTNPPIAIAPQRFYLPTGSHEPDCVFEYAKLWEQTVARLWALGASQPRGSERIKRADPMVGSDRPAGGRHVRALVLHKEARYCLIQRLLGPIKPPEQLLRLEANEPTGEQVAIVNRLCRYVSLLRPLKHEFLTLKTLSSSIWFDSSQLLRQWLGGESEEKATLLCNYLLYLGHCSALLLGDSIPEGRCVYVIVWREQTSLFSQVDDQSEVGTLRQAHEQVTRENFVSRLPIVLSWRSVQLIDANRGKIYSLADRALPLTSVGSIVTPENVYANIQHRDSPWPANEISFDVRIRSCWLALFEGTGGQSASSQLTRLLRANKRRRLMSQLQSSIGAMDSLSRLIVGSTNVQPIVSNPLALEPTHLLQFSPQECNQFEQRLEKTIKAHLLKWRPNQATYFNQTLSRLLADKLTSFEDCLYEGREQLEDWRPKLAELIRKEILMVQTIGQDGAAAARQVVSWPINLPFSSMKSILNSLFASGVHAADMMTMLDAQNPTAKSNNNTQFLVACHVRAYPARVLSVWLYVGAIVTNRPRKRVQKLL